MPRIPYRYKVTLRRIGRFVLILTLLIVIGGLALLIYFEPYVTYDRDGAHLNLKDGLPSSDSETTQYTGSLISNVEIVYEEPQASSDMIVDRGGYYITTAMLQDPQKVLQAVKELSPTAVVMIEVKSIFGNFYYPTSIAGAHTADVDISTVSEIISYMRSKNMHMVAVVPAYRDRMFALDNIPCGLALKSHALWVDEKSCYWLDPANDTVVSYLKQIVRELSSMGFQEIAFSEFLFPNSPTIVYRSEHTPQEIIRNAAKEMTDFFTGSNLIISFVTEDAEFPVDVCSGRIYIPNVDGTKVEKYAKAFGSQENLKELVFLASSIDTRFEDRAVLRPLVS